jgi:hypothetical protein
MAATAGPKPGIKGAVLRNTGTYGSPTWTEFDLVKDVSFPPAWDIADASSRQTRVKLNAKTMMGCVVGISVRQDDADTGYVAIDDAHYEDTVIDMLVLSGPLTTEGSRGVRMHFIVNKTAEDQSSGAIIYSQYDLLPAFSTEGDPKWIKVGAASALTAADPG